jgi:hypothetical protein
MASTISDLQKIVVTLSEEDIVIEPGHSAQLVVTMTNRQETPDRLTIEVEGIDVEWYAIPVPAVNVASGATASERIQFKISRNSENRAGTYPFLVRVQAMETGEVGVAQATLVIKPFQSLQMELDPRRAAATFFYPINEFEVKVDNLGNDEETLELFASDPDDGCAYEYDTDRIALKPGESRVVPLVIRPKSSGLIGGMRLYGFTATARSLRDSYVSASAHGQLEKRALISPLLGIFCLLLASVAGVWWMLRPTPPPPLLISNFAAAGPTGDATQKPIASGQSVTLTWNVSPPPPLSHIIINRRVHGVDIADPGEQHKAIDSIVVKPEPTQTIYTLTITGVRGQKPLSRQLVINVKPPPPAPRPAIQSFEISPPVIHQGDSAILSWKGHGKEFILDPGSIHLGPFDASYEVKPDVETTYELRAIGENNTQSEPQRVKVQVVSRDASIAVINRFVVKPAEVYVGDKVLLKWDTLYARSVRIDPDHGPPIGALASTSGSLEVQINDPTTFLLTATDSAGKTTVKTLTVTPKVRPIPEEPPVSSQPGETPLPGTPPPAPGTGQ